MWGIYDGECVKIMTRNQWSLVTFAVSNQVFFIHGPRLRGHNYLLKDLGHDYLAALKKK